MRIRTTPIHIAHVIGDCALCHQKVLHRWDYDPFIRSDDGKLIHEYCIEPAQKPLFMDEMGIVRLWSKPLPVKFAI